MVAYHVTIFIAKRLAAITLNNVFIKLVGREGESDRKLLIPRKGASVSTEGIMATFTVTCPRSIGKLVLIELDKKPLPLFPEDSWFPTKVEVKSPEGNVYIFPIYRWITDCEVHRFREGTALRVFEDEHPLGKYSREVELQQRKRDYRWDVYAEGLPHILKAECSLSLPSEIRFSVVKKATLELTKSSGQAEAKLKGLADCKESWTSTEDIDRVFCFRRTELSEYVQKHWKEDSFFGCQYLIGMNSTMIRLCKALPKNFPVTDEMVFPQCQRSLSDEMEKGNIFLCDYKLLDGIPSSILNGKKQYLMAPLVLFQKTTDDKLVPIAIQPECPKVNVELKEMYRLATLLKFGKICQLSMLKQKPGQDNPIFLPTDPEYDWLLAKMYVSSADFNEHQLSNHLLRTHLFGEVVTMSLMRNLPMVHPLYKLLIQHTRYTLPINLLARERLISKDGVFNKVAASAGEGMVEILRKSLSSVTYSSLCIPDDIAERGMESLPNYYYRDDGLKLWDIIHRFVENMLNYYYRDDCEVQRDSELQKWILGIFKHGFLSRTSSGIPQKFDTVAELIKFVTMVIFTVSAQHASVNSGQYDYGGWMPNYPSSMKLPPPTKKGESCEETMFEAMPDVNVTVISMNELWVLSRRSIDFVPLGQYPEQHFSEKIPCDLIVEFQRELKGLSTSIKARNKHLEVPYTYIDPEMVENSVAL